jgi:hypothetical protein
MGRDGMGWGKKFASENPNGRDHLEDLGIGRRIIIAVCVLEKQRGKMWTGFN